MMGICFSRTPHLPTPVFDAPSGTAQPPTPNFNAAAGSAESPTPVGNGPNPGQGPRANQDGHRARQLRAHQIKVQQHRDNHREQQRQAQQYRVSRMEAQLGAQKIQLQQRRDNRREQQAHTQLALRAFDLLPPPPKGQVGDEFCEIYNEINHLDAPLKALPLAALATNIKSWSPSPGKLSANFAVVDTYKNLSEEYRTPKLIEAIQEAFLAAHPSVVPA
jgi:hypothetical protein